MTEERKLKVGDVVRKYERPCVWRAGTDHPVAGRLPIEDGKGAYRVVDVSGALPVAEISEGSNVGLRVTLTSKAWRP